MRSPLSRFLSKAGADRRLLVRAAALHAVAAVTVRVLPFRAARRLIERAGSIGRRPRDVDDAGVRAVKAVRTVSAWLPGANCLTEALVAQQLLARYGVETTLRIGVARTRTADRPLDAHAWLERQGATLIGMREIAYRPLRPAGRPS